MKLKKYVGLIIFVMFCAGFSHTSAVLEIYASESRITKGGGFMTAVDIDGSVVINDKRYILSSSSRILDWQGRPIFIRELSLPARVYIEYQLTNGMEKEILLIKEVPQ